MSVGCHRDLICLTHVHTSHLGYRVTRSHVRLQKIIDNESVSSQLEECPMPASLKEHRMCGRSLNTREKEVLQCVSLDVTSQPSAYFESFRNDFL